MNCPEKEKLLEYSENELALEERRVLETHLAKCPSCVRNLASIRAATAFVVSAVQSHHDQVCPSRDVLWALASGTLEPGRLRSVKAHIDACVYCRSEMAIVRAQYDDCIAHVATGQNAALSLSTHAWQLAYRFVRERYREELPLFESLRVRFEELVERMWKRRQSRWPFARVQFAPAVAFASGAGKLLEDLATPAAQYVTASVLTECSGRKLPISESDLRKIIRKHIAKSKCKNVIARELEDFLVANLRSTLIAEGK